MATPSEARSHPGYRPPPADRASSRTLKRQPWAWLKPLDAYFARSAAASFAAPDEATAEAAMLKYALAELSPPQERIDE